uniref:Uncharacterized protein n=1 Tax=Globisporangium ultimum (strain ATCC 200006 / CBS 805.95 / DAOM BR144) TaxID=431595 RepID=K3W6K5_GLOUD
MAFRHACAEIIKQYPESAKAMEIDKRLWVSWYREIDGLQERVRGSSTSSQSTSSRSP